MLPRRYPHVDQTCGRTAISAIRAPKVLACESQLGKNTRTAYRQKINQAVTRVKRGSAKESGPRTSPESDTETEQKKPLHSAAHCIVFAASSTAHTFTPGFIHSSSLSRHLHFSQTSTSTSPSPYPVTAISIFSSFDSCFVFPNTSGRSFFDTNLRLTIYDLR